MIDVLRLNIFLQLTWHILTRYRRSRPSVEPLHAANDEEKERLVDKPHSDIIV